MSAKHTAAFAGLLLVLVLVTFGRTLGNEFVFDDHRIVESNPVVRTLDPVTHLTSSFWKREGRAAPAYDYYRPLVSASLALEWAVYGDRPAGYHLTNLLLHALAAFALFLLLREIAGGAVAAVAALLFAVHPVQTEAVAFVVGRTDLLSTALLLLAAWLYARLPDAPTRDSLAGFSSMMLALAGALLSKESAVTFPALALAIDVAGAEGGTWRARLRQAWGRFGRYAPYWAALIAGYVLLRYAVVGQLVGDPSALEESWRNPLIDASTGARLLTAVYVAFRYVALLFYPRALTVDYGFDALPLVRSAGSPEFLLAAGVLVALLSAVVWIARHSPSARFGLVAAAGTYALVSHVPFPGPVVMAERVLYLPMAGLTAIAGCVVVGLAERLAAGKGRDGLLAVLTLLFVLPLAARSYVRAGDWRDDLTLFEAAAKASPRSVLVLNNLGTELLKRGDYEAALTSFDKSLAVKPSYLFAKLNRAATMREMGRLEDAETVLRAAARDHPESGDVSLSLVPLLSLRADEFVDLGKPLRGQVLRLEAVEIAREQAEKAGEEGSFGAAATLLLAAAQNLHSLGDVELAEAAFEGAIDAAAREAAGGAAARDAAQRLQSVVLGSAAAFLVRTDRPLEGARRYEQAAEFARRASEPLLAARMNIDAGRAFLDAEQFQSGLAALRRAEQLATDDPELLDEARAGVSGALARTGDTAGAAALGAAPGSGSVKIVLAAAEASLQSGRAADALPLYEQVLGTDPSLARARHGRARARFEVGDLDGAERDLERLLVDEREGRRAAAVWNDLAKVSAARGDGDAALERLDRAVEADPGFAEARFHRGLLRLQTGAVQRAETDLTAAIEAGLPQPAEAEAWYHLAEAASRRGDREAARDRVRRCLEVEPGHRGAQGLRRSLGG